MTVSSTGPFFLLPPRGQPRQNLPEGATPAAPATTSPSVANAAPGTDNSATGLTAKKKPPIDPAQDFLDYMKKTPAERMRDAWLGAHGITKEQFAAMSPEEQQKLLNQMRQEIEEKLKQQVEKQTKGKINIIA